MQQKSKKAVFLIPYPLGEVPSQRFRFEQYIRFLKERNITSTFFPFFSQRSWKIRSEKSLFKKIWSLCYCTLVRPIHIARALSGDIIFIHRELAPVGPPLLEWLLAKVFRKKIIYDFDDAIWATDNKEENTLARLIRWRKKVSSICKWSAILSCGNEYLAEYGRRFNPSVVVMPTTIDTEDVHNPSRYPLSKRQDRIVIGWTGSRSTLKYLKSLEQVLTITLERYPHTDLLVIADSKPDWQLPRLLFKPWSKSTEIKDLLLSDIGIMPLPEDEWSMGKCGFKALQYMALEIPTVASPVGVNQKIICHGVNGFLCQSDDDWLAALDLLICNATLRAAIGKSGREKVLSDYSVSANKETFLDLFEQAYNQPNAITK